MMIREGLPLTGTTRVYSHDKGKFKERWTHYDNFSIECKKICRQRDYFTQKYTPRLMGSRPRSNRILKVAASKNPVIKTQTMPSIAIFSFMTNMLSTFRVPYGLTSTRAHQTLHLFLTFSLILAAEGSRPRYSLSPSHTQYIKQHVQEHYPVLLHLYFCIPSFIIKRHIEDNICSRSHFYNKFMNINCNLC